MKKHQITFVITILILCACSPGETITPTQISPEITPTSIPPTTSVKPVTRLFERTVLIFDQLINSFDPGSPVDDGAFAMPEDAKPAEHTFEGRLELIGEDNAGNILVHRGNPDVDPQVPHLPEFNFQFVQSGDYFIPTQRGLIITEHPIWNYLIEPGRVWREEGDAGYSRVSFPFALVWKGSNAIFNGVMTFLFNDGNISKVWYQTTQETTISFNADLWGQVDAVYHPEPERMPIKFVPNLRMNLHRGSPQNPSSNWQKIILRLMSLNSGAVSRRSILRTTDLCSMGSITSAGARPDTANMPIAITCAPPHIPQPNQPFRA